MKAPSAQPDHFVHDRLPPPEAWPTLRYDLPELQIANQANLVQALFDQAERWLLRDGPRTLWIGVWSENFGAQRFYARHGFERVGTYAFPVGRVRDLEFILRRPAQAGA